MSGSGGVVRADGRADVNNAGVKLSAFFAARNQSFGHRMSC